MCEREEEWIVYPTHVSSLLGSRSDSSSDGGRRRSQEVVPAVQQELVPVYVLHVSSLIPLLEANHTVGVRTMRLLDDRVTKKGPSHYAIIEKGTK